MSLPADSSCEGRVSLHFTQSGLSMPAAAGVVDEKGSEYILAPIGPRELDGQPLGGGGLGFGLVPGYTTLSVRVRANIKFGTLIIKSVRTRTIWYPAQKHQTVPHCTPLVCISAVIELLAVWRHNKPKTKKKFRVSQMMCILFYVSLI